MGLIHLKFSLTNHESLLTFVLNFIQNWLEQLKSHVCKNHIFIHTYFILNTGETQTIRISCKSSFISV